MNLSTEKTLLPARPPRIGIVFAVVFLIIGAYFHELVLHREGGLLTNPQVAPELQRRDVVLGLGERMHREERRRSGSFVASKTVPLARVL